MKSRHEEQRKAVLRALITGDYTASEIAILTDLDKILVSQLLNGLRMQGRVKATGDKKLSEGDRKRTHIWTLSPKPFSPQHARRVQALVEAYEPGPNFLYSASKADDSEVTIHAVPAGLIEHGVPIPGDGRKKGKHSDTAKQMRVGDSVFFDSRDKACGLRAALKSLGLGATTRRTDHGYRTWRTK